MVMPKSLVEKLGKSKVFVPSANPSRFSTEISTFASLIGERDNSFVSSSKCVGEGAASVISSVIVGEHLVEYLAAVLSTLGEQLAEYLAELVAGLIISPKATVCDFFSACRPPGPVFFWNGSADASVIDEIDTADDEDGMPTRAQLDDEEVIVGKDLILFIRDTASRAAF